MIQVLFAREVSPSILAARYLLFAAVATLVNILTQMLAFEIYDGGGALWLAMICGTGTGLVVKYVLDRHWIFFDRAPRSITRQGYQFALYSAMGLLTTALFWATELLFDHLGESPFWRYLGAVLGLSAGYLLKYHLDKRFVFVSAETS